MSNDTKLFAPLVIWGVLTLGLTAKQMGDAQQCASQGGFYSTLSYECKARN